MGFPRRPRPRPTQQGSSSSSTEQSSQRSQSDRQPSKRIKLSTKDETIFDREEMKAYIVVAKLTSSELDNLNRAIVKNGGQVVSSYEEATLVISNTRLWNRLYKYLTNYEKEPKKMLHISWVEDSLAAGHQMPMDEKYLIHRPLDVLVGQSGTGGHSATPSERASSPAPSEADPRAPLAPSSLANEVAPIRDNVSGGAGRATPPKWRNRRFACQRWHPLVCINQDMLLELRWIRDYNRLEGEERRSMTYSKAMAAIKSYPYPIKSAKEASAILGVGEKIAAQCEEYVKTGKIAAAEIIKKNPRMATLVEFTKIHGVGPTTARDLYDKYGCRTLADVEKIAHKLPTMGEESIMYVEEFDQRIPREEVEWMAAKVNDELQKIIPGAEYTIVGGYRRGKQLCGDVDIIFTHPEPGKEKGALEELLKRLQKAGWVTDILYIALTDSQRDHTMKHFHASHMDPLDKAFTVWLSPANGTTRPKPIHRRLDLIFAPRKYYACAVLGWSGSTTFERDLRLYAEKNKGLKFDSGGLFKRSNSEEIIVDTEKDIFDLLDLEYIPPEWRNCDI